jgi:hypothetical protein
MPSRWLVMSCCCAGTAISLLMLAGCGSDDEEATGTQGGRTDSEQRESERPGETVDVPSSCPTIEAPVESVGVRAITISVKGRASCEQATAVIKDLVAGRGTYHEGEGVARSYWGVRGWRCSHRNGVAGCGRREISATWPVDP